jgi:DNA-binding SARP family transcriptional activator
VQAPVVRVLGPLELASADGPVVLGLRQRLVLAVLVARVGRVAPADVLIEAVWGDDPPADPNGALQTLVSRLRARLPDGLLEPSPCGEGRRLLTSPTDPRSRPRPSRSTSCTPPPPNATATG